MKIAIAQIKPIKANISANIETHIKLINLAVSYMADAIFFPELSITGYEPALAKELATVQDDPRFDVFQELSTKYEITIGIGIPLKVQAGIQITMLIFQPNQAPVTYSKQQLHADELPYFVEGDKQIILTVNKLKIVPAICFESLQDNHAENVINLGADVYLASVAKSQKGIEKALIHYPIVAKRYSVPVLMANCVGYCDNFDSVGQSAVWTNDGLLCNKLNKESEGVLVFDTDTCDTISHVL